MTEYEATGRQRKIETTIRKWKREYAAMEAVGFPTAEASAKLAQWRNIEKDFLAQTGLKQQRDRTLVAGFGRSAAQKAVNVAKTAQKVAEEAKKEYNIMQQQIRSQVLSDAVSKELNIGNQNKHIKSSSGFITGRSYIFGDLQAAQYLIDKYHGTGEFRLNDKKEWTKKEFIQIDDDIGVVVNHISGAESRTNRFSIHYGKNGTHIVPARQGRRNK